MQRWYIDDPFMYSCFEIATCFFHFLAARSSIQVRKMTVFFWIWRKPFIYKYVGINLILFV